MTIIERRPRRRPIEPPRAALGRHFADFALLTVVWLRVGDHQAANWLLELVATATGNIRAAAIDRSAEWI